jgi:CheY-like chemotaxis protein
LQAALEAARAEAECIAKAAAVLDQASAREAQPVAAPAAPPQTSAAPPSPPKAREDIIVMVADDSKIVRVKTGRLLTAQGFQVRFAEDGLDAMRQIEQGPPDVLITDVEMPGMDGFALTENVRRQPATARMPVIMITAADDRHRDDAERAGVTVLLGKPYPEDVLIARIEATLQAASGSTSTV